MTGVGTVTFDVSDIVNGWIAGANSHQFIALTGKNDASGNDFLQGFVNNDNGGTALGVGTLAALVTLVALGPVKAVIVVAMIVLLATNVVTA